MRVISWPQQTRVPPPTSFTTTSLPQISQRYLSPLAETSMNFSPQLPICQSNLLFQIILLHWSSVKEFSCLKAIDFTLEACLKSWLIYMKSIPCSSS